MMHRAGYACDRRADRHRIDVLDLSTSSGNQRRFLFFFLFFLGRVGIMLLEFARLFRVGSPKRDDLIVFALAEARSRLWPITPIRQFASFYGSLGKEAAWEGKAEP